MKAIFVIAVLGLISSAVAHFSTFLGIHPQHVCPQVWYLHLLVLGLWIAIVISMRDIRISSEKRKYFWEILSRNAPMWMKTLTAFLFIYCLFTFFYCFVVLNEGGGLGEIRGKKVLHNHGRVIRELTDEEYEKHQAYGIRGFSGGWMLAYAAGMMVLYSQIKGTGSTES